MPFLGQLPGHHVGGVESHHGMEADIVLAAERPRIGERRRGHELIQLRAAAQPVNQHRLQLDGRRLLHQGHQRLQLAKRQACRGVFGTHVGAETEVQGNR